MKTDLSDANLSKADIYLANFTGANLSQAVVGRGIFGDVDLSTVKWGLRR